MCDNNKSYSFSTYKSGEKIVVEQVRECDLTEPQLNLIAAEMLLKIERELPTKSINILKRLLNREYYQEK